jgi:hypothetical protein
MLHVFEKVRVTTSGRVLVEQRQRRPVGELGVRLVGDHEPGRDVEQLDHALGGLDQPGRVVGRREEHDVGPGGVDDAPHLRGSRVKSALRSPSTTVDPTTRAIWACIW